jgi:hypothetical protein
MLDQKRYGIIALCTLAMLFAMLFLSTPVAAVGDDPDAISSVTIVDSTYDLQFTEPVVTLRVTCLMDLIRTRVQVVLTQSHAGATTSSIESFYRVSSCTAGEVVTYSVRFGQQFLPGRAQITGTIEGIVSCCPTVSDFEDVGPATLLLRPFK